LAAFLNTTPAPEPLEPHALTARASAAPAANAGASLRRRLVRDVLTVGDQSMCESVTGPLAPC
jgi:hypothetical protein